MCLGTENEVIVPKVPTVQYSVCEYCRGHDGVLRECKVSFGAEFLGSRERRVPLICMLRKFDCLPQNSEQKSIILNIINTNLIHCNHHHSKAKEEEVATSF